ncbi:hypothetical protein [Burkholderia gladioli]|uniref:hypothetical protein n=1 Tax=Burkholderia gladioli TaxID=28095 RepID=UPI000F5422AB|nr:hypothetical protein [Burkholderia gladioli]MBU9426437.1 hypothetical protein [Burkholderia gladioli]MDN8063398.1 hypothetical protein [Burkholderia gladioli]
MDREQRDEASRRWVQAAAEKPEAQALIALGWQVVSPYGYSHASGWTIEDIRTDGKWDTLLWEGRHIHKRFESPLEAANYHADLMRAR